MIESVLKLFEKDPLWQNKMKTPAAAHLTSNDVLRLTHLVEVLSPLADLTDKMQRELGNLGMLLPAVNELKSMLLKPEVDLPVSIASFAETLASNVSSRYRMYYDEKHAIFASLLDPHFKTEWIIRDGLVCNKLGEIRDLLVKETEEMPRASGRASGGAGDIASPNPAPDPAGRLIKKPRMFGSYFSEHISEGDVKSEVEGYLSSPRSNPDQDVLEFWKTNSKNYPRLNKVARKVFSIPSGSASAERVFSAAGLMARNHRMSLEPKHWPNSFS